MGRVAVIYSNHILVVEFQQNFTIRGIQNA